MKTFINHNLSSEQLQIITGSMLGDGCLRMVGRHKVKNSSFAEVHGIKQHDWLGWKYEKLKPLSSFFRTFITDGRKVENGRVVCDPTKKSEQCRIQTISHPTLTELERKWYLRDENGEYVLKGKRRIKKIPEDLELTPLILAVWFFDDGSNNAAKRVAIFNTQSYTKNECEMLVDKLKDFGIDCGVAKNRHQFIIQTKVVSYLNLINLVTEFLPCECVRYKVDLSKYKEPDFSTRFQCKVVL